MGQKQYLQAIDDHTITFGIGPAGTGKTYLAVARRQAEVAGHEEINEILMLLTHGMLHLVGFDHAEPEEEKEMFALQKELLDSFYEVESNA
jgi:rRNA maturation RNase YbeY